MTPSLGSALTRTRSGGRSLWGTFPRRSRSCKGPCGWGTKGTGRSRGSSPVRRSPRPRSGVSLRGSPAWETTCGSRSAEPRRSHRGGTLKLASRKDSAPDTLDPAVAYDPYSHLRPPLTGRRPRRVRAGRWNRRRHARPRPRHVHPHADGRRSNLPVPPPSGDPIFER